MHQHRSKRTCEREPSVIWPLTHPWSSRKTLRRTLQNVFQTPKTDSRLHPAAAGESKQLGRFWGHQFVSFIHYIRQHWMDIWMLIWYESVKDFESSRYSTHLQNFFMCCEIYSQMHSDTNAVYYYTTIGNIKCLVIWRYLQCVALHCNVSVSGKYIARRLLWFKTLKTKKQKSLLMPWR